MALALPGTRRVFGVLGVIVALGLALRLAGVQYGLPAVYNPDEVAIMSRALAFAKGDLNPHNFLYPSLFFYALFGWIGAYFVAARVLGFAASLQAFQSQFFLDPSAIYLAGRILTVLCGAATIVLVYRLGVRLFGRSAGVVAALFMAVAPFHVRDSHYVKHDVPVTLAVVACSLAIVRLWQGRGNPPDPCVRPPADTTGPGNEHGAAWPAALLFGLACSIHYYAVFLALPLTLALVATTRTPGWLATVRRLAGAGVTSAVAFFLTSPFILAEPLTAWRDITANRQIVVDRAIETGGNWFSGAAAYARMLWLDAAGWPVVLLALAGAVWLIFRSPRRAILILSFPLAFLAFIANTVPASRYLNPVLPFLSVLAACAVVRLASAATTGFVAWRADRLARRGAAAQPGAVPDTGATLSWARWTIVALAASAALPGLASSLRADLFFRQADTRTLAQQFIERAIPPGSTILLQPYSVPLRQSRDSLVESLERNLGNLDRTPTKFALQLSLTPYPAPAYRLIFLGDGGLDAEKIYVAYRAFTATRSLEPIRALGVRYVALKRYNRADPATRPFLDALAVGAQRIALFSP
ncbi:MAG: glycosyltransferase family 39 protein, partial [Acidobacteria bacterium]|nr:glycosyltransferase family 39 protein [Acidobacteriota bacterium]